MRKYYLTLLMFLLALTGCGKPDQPSIGLYLAIQRGDLDQIERHIQWGSDINMINKDGQRPLNVAASRGRYIIAKLLIESGADINAVNQEGQSAVYSAVMAGRTQIAELLVKRGAEIDPDKLLEQMIISHVNDRDIIPLLISWGADINHQGSTGKTPLILAISDRQRVIAKFLIASGADVNIPDKSGVYPLELATSLEESDITRLLMRNGATTR